MVQPSEIRPRMEVLGADGAHVGRVEAVEGHWIRLADEAGGEGGGYRQLPLSSVASVDDAVRLSESGAAARAMLALPPPGQHQPHGPLPPVRNRMTEERRPRGNYYLPWIVGIVGLLLLIGLVHACTRKPPPPPGPPAPPTAASDSVPALTPKLASIPVALPDGTRMTLRPDTIAYSLQHYLASNQPAPRTFGVNALPFDQNGATLQPAADATLDALGQVLHAYPRAAITVVGYPDARNDAAPDRLARDRADAVAAALRQRGVAGTRMRDAAGDRAHRTDVDRTAGAGGDQRVEIVVTAK